MLKLAGQKKGVTYEKPFNTVLTGDLVLAISGARLRRLMKWSPGSIKTGQWLRVCAAIRMTWNRQR